MTMTSTHDHESPVLGHIAKVDAATAELVHRVQALVGRLQPYCTPSDAVDGGMLAEQPTPISPLEQRFEQVEEKIMDMIRDLDALDRRLRL